VGVLVDVAHEPGVGHVSSTTDGGHEILLGDPAEFDVSVDGFRDQLLDLLHVESRTSLERGSLLFAILHYSLKLGESEMRGP